MKVLNSVYWLFGAFLLGGPVIFCAQTKVIREVPVHNIRTVDGSQLFREYCAACHGVDGKGSGPAAEALKRAPGDLTQLSRNNDGRFPALAVQASIRGSAQAVLEHGTVEMPIWGQAFRQVGQNPSFVEMKIYALMKYVEQIQAK